MTPRRRRSRHAIARSACAWVAGLAAWGLLVPLAHADPVGILNRLRASGCRGAHGAPSLRETRALDDVAERLARGASLHAALAAATEWPASAGSIHLRGVASDADLARALLPRHCNDLADASLREVGVARGGNDLWIVFAAPMSTPAPRDPSDVENEVLDRVNAARVHGRDCGRRHMPAVPAVQPSAVLTTVAADRADVLARSGRLEHEGADGSTPADRVRRAGYSPTIVGENIAQGVPTAREVVEGWLASPGHCENIMDPRFTEMGVAYASNPRIRGGIFWTQLFSSPRSH